MFSVFVTFVNHPPDFSINQTEIGVWQQNISTIHSFPMFATNISKGPAGSDQEHSQNLTFTCSIIMSTYLTSGSMSCAVDTSGTLSLSVNACSLGRYILNLTLYDSGGRENFGMDTSKSQITTVKVAKLNQQPSFYIRNTSVLVAESQNDNTFVFPAFVRNITSGLCIERNHHISFSVTPVEAQVGTTDSTAITDLFLRNANGQLFADNSTIAIDNSGTLNFTVAKFRNGAAKFRAILLTDEKSITDSNGFTWSSNISEYDDFEILVLPVNSQPRFFLSSGQVNFEEASSLQTRGNQHNEKFVSNISAGGWDEQGQALTFVMVYLAGPQGLISEFSVACLDPPCTGGGR
jgi:hypothetical protein